MKLKRWMTLVLSAALLAPVLPADGAIEVQAEEPAQERTELNFDTGWLYSNVDYSNGEAVNLNESDFESVSVPHANKIIDRHSAEDFEADIGSYRFVSWYRRHFTLPESYSGRNIMVEFEGVATIAEIYVNGNYVDTHEGAYTTFTVDISDYVYTDGRDNVLAVRVDSTRQPELPPEGGNVDYCLFGGIVRDVTMIITDPVYVERTFVTTPGLEEGQAVVRTQADISNKLDEDKTYTVSAAVEDAEGNVVASASEEETLTAGQETTVTVETEEIENPHLWNLDDPYLYTVVTEIRDGDTVIDTYNTKIGMRYIEFKDGTDGDGSFYLNGEKTEIVGINRHEQWPWIGRAVPDKLQEQDADLIKADGINLVRCSHYPQDPSFLERCDEIGLLVFIEAPGWQHVGDDQWKENFKTNLTELILRDRNHPSIISWGVTPNESRVDTAFNTECNELAKSLDPTRPTHGVRIEFDLPDGSGGEKDTVVTDILTVNYQYPEDPPHVPYIVSEHSNDWWGDGRPDANNEQARLFIDSFAQTMDYYYRNDDVAGGIGWSMFDYNNEVNYTNSQHVFYSGLYDLWRYEKPVAYLYKTQQDIEDAGAIVYIANNWADNSSSTVYVMSNCDEVELFVNGTSQGRITPNKFTNLPHPVFEFTGITYSPGELRAVGYVNGEAVEETTRTTPGEAVALVAEPDYSTLTADGTDMTSVLVKAVDANGNEVPYAANTINVTQTSGTETTLISEENVALEGGHIAFLVQSGYGKTGTAEFEVTSDGLQPATCSINIEAYEADNLVPVSQGAQEVNPELPELYNMNDTKSGSRLYELDYEGNGWQYGTETGAYSGDNHWTNTAGDTVTIRFKGTGIQYCGAKAPGHGIAAFSVDGGEEEMVDLYQAQRQDQLVLFEVQDLEYGEHTLTVRVTGDRNPAAADSFVVADQVVICNLSQEPAEPAAISNNTFMIENVEKQGHRVVVDGNSLDVGRGIITWTNETTMAYRWAFKEVDGGYQIVNANSNLVMTATDGRITQEEANGNENQIWILESVSGTDNCYRIRNEASGTYLTATNTSAYGTGYELSVADRAADNNQIWILDETDTCIIQAEMENGSIEPQAANVTKGDSQEFTATPAEGYEIASVTVNGSVLSEDDYTISEEGVLTFTLSDITENQYVTVTAREPGEPEVPVLTELRVTEPEKLEYQIGETLDLDGFKVEAAYADGTVEDVTEDVEIAGFDSDTAGEKTIVVTYGGLEDSFTVTVVRSEEPDTPVLTELRVTEPEKLEYQIGETLDLDGFKVEAVYDDGTVEDVTEDVEIAGFDSDTPGEKTVIVSYGGLEESFTVTVIQTEDPTTPGGSDEDPTTPGGSDEDPTTPGSSNEDPAAPGDGGGSLTPSDSGEKDSAVQTGDETSFGMYVVLLAAAGAAMGVVVKKRKTTE